MAAFPGYTESTLLVGMGLLGTGADTIEGVEDAKKNGNPVGIRTQTNWTKTSCATITQRGYSRYFVIYSNVCNLQIKKADFFK